MSAGGRPIRVLIVDDHEMVRSGLTAFLRSAEDLELVGEASNGREAIQLSAELCPDVVLMDLHMPEVDGVEAIRVIRECQPEIRVVALTSFPEAGLVERALQAGALSYLLKNVSASELADAVRAAYAGRPTLAPEAAQALIQQVTRSTAPSYDLSRREREVLTLMARGMSNRAIAGQLFISPSTVDFHAGNIYSKLGVSSRTQAVAMAVKHGLVDHFLEKMSNSEG